MTTTPAPAAPDLQAELDACAAVLEALRQVTTARQAELDAANERIEALEAAINETLGALSHLTHANADYNPHANYADSLLRHALEGDLE